MNPVLPDTAVLARQLADRLDELGSVSDEPDRLIRTFLSPASLRANAAVGGWMREAGLAVREDAYGNLTGTRDGLPGSGKWVIGSHLDTVVDAGRFDGPLGVLLGIAVAAALPDLPFGLEVVAFSDEEGVRFQSTYLGSRAYAGLMTPENLARRGKDGISVGELIAARRLAGYHHHPVDTAELRGYLELHIEQGPVLEAADLPLGVVQGVAGQTRVWAGFTGKAGHAGTTPMPLRRDALTAAAHMILLAETYARENAPLLATIGRMEVLPGAGNVIPGEVRFSLDVRSPNDAARRAGLEDLNSRGTVLARERGLIWRWEVTHDCDAVAFDPALIARLTATVAAHQPDVPQLFSGAGHDAAVMATVCPAAMLLVRCRDGLSHHPDEYTAPADLAAALQAAVHFMHSLAGEFHA